MFVSKLNTSLILLALGITALGTAVLTHRTLAADQGRAADAVGGQVSADLPPTTHALHDEARLPPEAARLYAYTRTPLSPAELAYRQIPWLVDLNEGLRVARSEKRPLLLWTSGDDPLDRC